MSDSRIGHADRSNPSRAGPFGLPQLKRDPRADRIMSSGMQMSAR